MMSEPQAALLPDGKRLHLHHGPIDLIVGVEGADRELALERATERFRTVLAEIVEELAALQVPFDGRSFDGAVAQRMARAVAPFAEARFVTPMAAVAGSVAEEILGAMSGIGLDMAIVNNGGDIAFHLAPGRSIQVLGPAGQIEIGYEDTARGVATSGWRGRSLSFGIADAVTVLARTASMADAAATMIANEVDLRGRPAIRRRPASEIEAHPQLKERLVTAGVGDLAAHEIAAALDKGQTFAAECRAEGMIEAAVLALHGETRVI